MKQIIFNIIILICIVCLYGLNQLDSNVSFKRNLKEYKYGYVDGDVFWTSRSTWMRGDGWVKEVQFGLHTNGLIYWRDVNNQFNYENNNIKQ
jgi:hypothetical protein